MPGCGCGLMARGAAAGLMGPGESGTPRLSLSPGCMTYRPSGPGSASWGKRNPLVEAGCTCAAAATRPDPGYGGRPFNHVAQTDGVSADRLVADESGQLDLMARRGPLSAFAACLTLLLHELFPFSLYRLGDQETARTG